MDAGEPVMMATTVRNKLLQAHVDAAHIGDDLAQGAGIRPQSYRPDACNRFSQRDVLAEGKVALGFSGLWPVFR